MIDALGIRERGGRRHPSPSGSFWGLRPSRSPALASHPRPNPNSSSPAARALSFITNNNDAYRIAWTYPTSSDPTPALPRGPLPRPRAFGVGGRILGPGRQAWARPVTHLSVFALRVKPPGGVADASVSFFLYLYVLFMNGLHSGQGRGAEAPILPADAGGSGCPGSLSPPLNPDPTWALPSSPRPRPHSVANFRPSMPKPRRRPRPTGPPHWPPPL